MPRVLVVDADVNEAHALATHLESELFSVEVSANPFRLEILTPDIDVLILQLVPLDGPGSPMPELYGQVRQHASTRALPWLIISGSADEATKVAALDMGADDYVVKPYGLRELAARVRALLRRASLRSEQPF